MPLVGKLAPKIGWNKNGCLGMSWPFFRVFVAPNVGTFSKTSGSWKLQEIPLKIHSAKTKTFKMLHVFFQGHTKWQQKIMQHLGFAHCGV